MTDLMQTITAFAFVGLAVVYIAYRIRRFRQKQSGCADCRLRNLQKNTPTGAGRTSPQD